MNCGGDGRRVVEPVQDPRDKPGDDGFGRFQFIRNFRFIVGTSPHRHNVKRLTGNAIGGDCRHVDDIAVARTHRHDLHRFVEPDQKRADHR